MRVDNADILCSIMREYARHGGLTSRRSAGMVKFPNRVRRIRRLIRTPYGAKSGLYCFCQPCATGVSSGGYILAEHVLMFVRLRRPYSGRGACSAFWRLKPLQQSRCLMTHTTLSVWPRPRSILTTCRKRKVPIPAASGGNTGARMREENTDILCAIMGEYARHGGLTHARLSETVKAPKKHERRTASAIPVSSPRIGRSTRKSIAESSAYHALPEVHPAGACLYWQVRCPGQPQGPGSPLVWLGSTVPASFFNLQLPKHEVPFHA